jgi:hypothetical protein
MVWTVEIKLHESTKGNIQAWTISDEGWKLEVLELSIVMHFITAT